MLLQPSLMGELVKLPNACSCEGYGSLLLTPHFSCTQTRVPHV